MVEQQVPTTTREATAPAAWEPRIIAFLCYWCSYTGADNAGTARLKYPANIDIIRLMCSGRIDPELIMTAFASGADGVMVCGCHIGDCHYLTGQPQDDGPHAASSGRCWPTSASSPSASCTSGSARPKGEKFAQLVRQVTEQVRARRTAELAGADARARCRPRDGPEDPGESDDERERRHGRANGKLKVAKYWASSCGGCDISLLEIGPHLLELIEAADVVFWPCAADFKYAGRGRLPRRLHRRLPVQRRHPQLASRRRSPACCAGRARRWSPTARAPSTAASRRWPTCRPSTRRSCDARTTRARRRRTRSASSPSRSRRRRTATSSCRASTRRCSGSADVVEVDYQIPGCPPQAHQVWKVLQAVVAGAVPARNQARRRSGCDDKVVCDECPREKRKTRIKAFVRPHREGARAGLVPARAGLRVHGAGHPQRVRRAVPQGEPGLPRLLHGVRATSQDRGTAMIGAIGSLLDATTEERARESGGPDRRSGRHVLPLQPRVEHA